MRVPQIANLARVYRLRGTVLRAFRALVLLDVFARLLRTTPAKRLELLHRQLAATQAEARRIRMLISRTERQIRRTESRENERAGGEPPVTDRGRRPEILDS